MDWNNIFTLLAGMLTVGTFQFFNTRRSSARLAAAEAKAAEFDILKNTVEFLQTQLRESEVKYAELVKRHRSTQDELLKANEEKYEAKLELAVKKCEDIPCPFREPPTAYTKPKPDISKEQYHAQKEKA